MKLKINNQELEFKLGVGFLGELIDETGKSLEDVLSGIDNNPYKYVPIAMYVSAKYALERQGKEVGFNKYEFTDWIEADGGLTDKNESAITFLKELTKDLTKDVPVDEGGTEGSKKK